MFRHFSSNFTLSTEKNGFYPKNQSFNPNQIQILKIKRLKNFKIWGEKCVLTQIFFYKSGLLPKVGSRFSKTKKHLGALFF
jgi:hypothetical protein